MKEWKGRQRGEKSEVSQIFMVMRFKDIFQIILLVFSFYVV